MVSTAVRARAFGQLVDRALRAARDRGLTVPEIEKLTGVSKSTFYRWRRGQWTEDPRPSEVKAFCAGLEVPVEAAWQVLRWGRAVDEAVPPPAEPEIPAEFRALLRDLADPNVSEDRKAMIRAAIRGLAEGSPHRRRA